MASKNRTDDKGGDTKVAEAGTAAQASQGAGDDAVVIGAAKVPTTPGGPGAGAAQTAEPVEGVVTEPLTNAAAAGLGLRGPLTEAERAELEQLRGETDPERFQLDMLRSRRDNLVVDAKDIPGTRLAEALTLVKRNGVDYSPTGERWVPVDFKSYTQLVEIGAIAKTPFHQLEPVRA